MTTVFFVNYARVDPRYEDSAIFIGVFSTRELAEKAVASRRSVYGFKDYPEGFIIEEIEVDVEFWNEGYFVEPFDAGPGEASNPPPWAKELLPGPSENAAAYAERLCNRFYGRRKYRTGPDSELFEIRKYGDIAD
jgi:hypothetical protein